MWIRLGWWNALGGVVVRSASALSCLYNNRFYVHGLFFCEFFFLGLILRLSEFAFGERSEILKNEIFFAEMFCVQVGNVKMWLYLAYLGLFH